jgi:hypothetical protein
MSNDDAEHDRAKRPAGDGGPEEGKRLRDQAVDSVEAANTEWCAFAYVELFQLCQEREEFTSEDLWQRVRREDVKEPRAMGSVFTNARRAKMCERTDRVVEAKRAPRHRGSVRVWRSLICHKQPGLPGAS